jgi:hypothetical protein
MAFVEQKFQVERSFFGETIVVIRANVGIRTYVIRNTFFICRLHVFCGINVI